MDGVVLKGAKSGSSWMKSFEVNRGLFPEALSCVCWSDRCSLQRRERCCRDVTRYAPFPYGITSP